MRVIVAGKGGVGKTTVAAAMATALRRARVDVMAVDADGSPNLALSLGAGDPERLPAVANETLPAVDDACAEDMLTEDLVEEFAVETPSGVRMVQAGRIERPSKRCLCCGSHATAREVIAALPGRRGQIVVVDLEAGLNDLLWARPGPGDVLLVVTDASARSLEVARRILDLGRELGVDHRIVVANKLRPDEVEVVGSALAGHPLLEITYDERLETATPGGDGDEAVRKLAEQLAASIP